MAALLVYLGALTIGAKTAQNEIILEIPNLVMRKLYAERILDLTFRTVEERDEAKSQGFYLVVLRQHILVTTKLC